MYLKKYNLKKDYDFLIVDFHGEITSEKNAIGHYFDGKATLVIGTHTHIPTNDARILKNVFTSKSNRRGISSYTSGNSCFIFYTHNF